MNCQIEREMHRMSPAAIARVIPAARLCALGDTSVGGPLGFRL